MDDKDMPQSLCDMLELSDDIGKLTTEKIHGKDIAYVMAISTGALTMFLGKIYMAVLLSQGLIHHPRSTPTRCGNRSYRPARLAHGVQPRLRRW